MKPCAILPDKPAIWRVIKPHDPADAVAHGVRKSHEFNFLRPQVLSNPLDDLFSRKQARILSRKVPAAPLRRCESDCSGSVVYSNEHEINPNQISGRWAISLGLDKSILSLILFDSDLSLYEHVLF